METAFNIKIHFSQDLQKKNRTRPKKKKQTHPQTTSKHFIWVKIFRVVMGKMLPVVSLPFSGAHGPGLRWLLCGTATTLDLLLLPREGTSLTPQAGRWKKI